MPIVPLLEIILLPGIVKSRMSLLVLVLKLSIKLWLILLPRCYGFTFTFATNLGIDVATPMQMYCDNQAAVFITSNLVFHEHTNISKLTHFIRDLLMKTQIVAPHVSSDDQPSNILMKQLARASFQRLSFKLGMICIL